MAIFGCSIHESCFFQLIQGNAETHGIEGQKARPRESKILFPAGNKPHAATLKVGRAYGKHPG
jgi:hypothetical protein